MNALQRRIKNVIERVGDTFTVGGTARKGVFTVLPASAARDYLPQGEIDAAPRPLRLVYTAFDDPSAMGNTVSWSSITLTVRKVVEVRYQDSLIAKLLVLY